MPENASSLSDYAPGPLLPRIARAALSEYLILLIAGAYFLAALLFVEGLATRGNLSSILARMLPLLAVAVGQTVVLITAGIDLSVTSIIALASVAGAQVMTDNNTPTSAALGIATMLGVGVAVGLFNGLAITLLRMPPFIVTLATMTVAGGAALWATGSRNIGDLPDAFTDIAWADFPWLSIIVGLLTLLAHFILRWTLLGRWLYAVGMNPRASFISGVPVRSVTVFAYAFSGLCAAVASVLYTAQLWSGSPTLGGKILLDVVGAAVIGGTSLFGGRGKVTWTLFGVLLFVLLDNTLEARGFQFYEIWMIKGAVILAAAILDLIRNRLLRTP
jgi:ribose transport system permease protein